MRGRQARGRAAPESGSRTGEAERLTSTPLTATTQTNMGKRAEDDWQHSDGPVGPGATQKLSARRPE